MMGMKSRGHERLEKEGGNRERWGRRKGRDMGMMGMKGMVGVKEMGMKGVKGMMGMGMEGMNIRGHEGLKRKGY